MSLYHVCIRRLLVPFAKEGDDASHTVGSIFLEMALRSSDVQAAAVILELADRMSTLGRAFGMQLPINGFMPFPKMDRPELVRIAQGSYTGGDNTMCARQLTAAGPVYRRVELESSSLIANGAVLQTGTVFGPSATLGNKSATLADEVYEDGVYMGAPAKLLFSTVRARAEALDNEEEQRPKLQLRPVVTVVLVQLSLELLSRGCHY